MTIHAVLFDADGVVQRPVVPWRAAFAPILRSTDPASLDAFLQDVMQAESSCLCTPGGFDAALAQVMVKWQRSGHVTEILRAMNAIDVYEEVMRVVLDLHNAGVPCHIASNQQAGRARHMSAVLDYRTRFTREFYSCHLGAAKPDSAFFERVLQALDLRGDNVLFLDDRPENVEAARRAGLAAAVYAAESGVPVLHRILAEHGLRVA